MNQNPDSQSIEAHLLATLQSIAEFNESWKHCPDPPSRESLTRNFHQSWAQWNHAQGQASVLLREIVPFFGLLAEPTLRDLAHANDRLKWWRDAMEAVQRPDLRQTGAFAKYSAIFHKPVRETEVLIYYEQALRETGRPEAAHEVVEGAIQLSPDSPPNLLNDRALALFSQGRFTEAAAAFRHAQDVANRRGDHVNRAIAIGNLGMVMADLGDNQTALAHHEEARQLAREYGLEELETNQIGNMGIIFMDLGLFDRSIEYLEDARRRHVAAGRSQGVRISDLELIKARFLARQIDEERAQEEAGTVTARATEAGYSYAMKPPSQMSGTDSETTADVAEARKRIEAAERSPSIWTRLRRLFD